MEFFCKSLFQRLFFLSICTFLMKTNHCAPHPEPCQMNFSYALAKQSVQIAVKTTHIIKSSHQTINKYRRNINTQNYLSLNQ